MTSEASRRLCGSITLSSNRFPRALLMFRLGDFYELFYDDAVTAARELEITLTSRNKEKGQAIPMCGVPYHAAEGYIARLIQRGYRVAICDQMEDPRIAKKLVKRELTRIVLARNRDGLRAAALAREQLPGGGRHGREPHGLAHVDVSTGEFRVNGVGDGGNAGGGGTVGAKEILVADGSPLRQVQRAAHRGGRLGLRHDYAERTLREHFGLLTLEGCGLGGRNLAVAAAGAVLRKFRLIRLKFRDRKAYEELVRQRKKIV